MIPASLEPIFTHLWQSTLFAGVLVLATLALRNHRAAVRFWLWLAASLKFLVPFSFLVMLGGSMRWSAVPTGQVQPAAEAALQRIEQVVFLPNAAVVPARVAPHAGFALLWGLTVGLWVCGFVFFAVRWIRRWCRMRALIRRAAPVNLGLPFPVVTAAARLEPGVFGIVRPVLFLPEGIRERLTPAQMRALVEHELCHARRRDNLWAAVQAAVEALFWFHPLVWWAGVRMLAEREAACDEAVLRGGADAEVYATSVLETCRFYAESPAAAMAGITGADLKRRVLTIASRSFGRPLSPVTKLLLAGVGATLLALPVSAGILFRSQSPAPALRFDVVSIKPAPLRGHGETTIMPGGNFRAPITTLDQLIALAYDLPLPEYQLTGNPAWAKSARFDIDARSAASFPNLPAGENRAQVQLMLQAMLAERFHLVIHHTTRLFDGYDLVLAPGGLKHLMHFDATTVNPYTHLPEEHTGSAVYDDYHGGVTIFGTAVDFCGMLSFSDATGKPVEDKTGLEGDYKFDVQWRVPASPEETKAADAHYGLTPAGVRTMEATMERQLGLRLVKAKVNLDVVVVDHASTPSVN